MGDEMIVSDQEEADLEEEVPNEQREATGEEAAQTKTFASPVKPHEGRGRGAQSYTSSVQELV